ncbi:DUF6483 family protein [Cohnella fermenti]|uniref:Tetratricopeptide repeat protein n=1 Tax=Cohnella fermenti TaxID=2565925 RepID=A0A4S4BR92_9BACL|nr:DUF6483 family protein [Cohnella fermenti]THF77506.1 hypothetical protein E6C55_15935 [Cohnella fermenti]
MYSRDYLMRMITQMTQMMGQLMGLKEQKRNDEALALIDEFLNKELRLRTKLALGLSDEDLLQMLSVGGLPNMESVAMVAIFLQEEGEILEGQGSVHDSLPRYEKALRLMLYVLRESGPIKGFELERRSAQLIERTEPYERMPETKHALWLWYERERRLADAEDLLYELHDGGGVRFEAGMAFYERLERLEDAELEEGGLSREELAEGKEQWRLLAGETVS